MGRNENVNESTGAKIYMYDLERGAASEHQIVLPSCTSGMTAEVKEAQRRR